MQKQTKLTDAQKLQCFDYIRQRGDALQTMSAFELANELREHIGRPISPEIARHHAKVCGAELNRRGSAAQLDSSIREVLISMHATIEQLAGELSTDEMTLRCIYDLRSKMQRIR